MLQDLLAWDSHHLSSIMSALILGNFTSAVFLQRCRLMEPSPVVRLPLPQGEEERT